MIDCACKSGIICLLQCSYISKIMPIIMQVFVNHAHFSKKMQKLCIYFYSKFVKNTSITTQQTNKFTLFRARLKTVCVVLYIKNSNS